MREFGKELGKTLNKEETMFVADEIRLELEEIVELINQK